MQKITPFLWFDGNAEEAMNLYTTLFKNAKVHAVSRYGAGAPLPAGTVMSATFELDGQRFIALNGGPMYKFTPAISMFVSCETQAEIDELWEKLTADGGSPGQCGWLQDKFGLSWQLVPPILGQLLSNPATSGNVMTAMLQMTKLDIAALQAAADQG
jgi:predicted 3-demethylubiquinone-9 3-methyltransferase (glyoxalase superfamily)